MENHSSSGLFLFHRRFLLFLFLPFSIFLFFYFLLASQLVSIENYFSPSTRSKNNIEGH